MINVIPERLVSLLKRGALLGDLVCGATGNDVHVTRFVENHLDMITGQTKYRLLHRTTASIAGLKLGSARTYWSGTEEAWSALAGIRMRRILHMWHFAVAGFSFDRSNLTVRRCLRSQPPGGRLLIAELLLLEPMLSLGLPVSLIPASGKDRA